MHEASVMNRIVSIATRYARKGGARKVTKLVLQIGQMSDVIPDALRLVYPMCTENTMLEGVTMEIEPLPAMGKCKQCEHVYNLLEHEFKCPKCSGEQWELLSGRELLIKELEVM